MSSPTGTGTAGDQRTVAGRYALMERLGSGGMGTVWRAHDRVLGREVAVKEVVFPHGLSDDDREVLRERTRREARAAARLDHPSAVTVYDVVEDSGSPFLVMELVDARTLSDVVRTDGPLSPRQAAEVGLAVLGALEAAHASGIVHRDVKPGNVLLCTDADADAVTRVVLTDFGIATSAGDSSITGTGLLLGSPSYIAPERARGQQPGPPSDLWSLGATLFTAVEGRPPYDAGEALATVTAVVTGDHAPFVSAGPLEPVISGLIERDPEQRLDAGSARAMLQQVVRGADPGPSTTQPRPTAPTKVEGTTVLPVRAMHEAAAAAEAEAAPASPPAPPVRPAPTVVRTGRPPRPGSPARRRTVVPLVLALLLLGAAVAGAAVLLADRDDPGSSAAPGSSADPAPDASPGPDGDEAGSGAGDATDPSPSATGSPAPPRTQAGGAEPPPEGWQTFTGGPGWTAAVPPSYVAGTFDGEPQYRDPQTGRTLRVTTTGPGGGKDDAVQDRRDQAASFARSHGDYEEIRIEPVDYRGYEAADWEFTYSSGGSGLHAISRVFVVDGRGYSLFFQTRSSDDFEAARQDFEQIAASFQPA